MKKTIFWGSTLVSIGLFICSWALIYPLGYHTNTFIYIATLLVYIYTFPAKSGDVLVPTRNHLPNSTSPKNPPPIITWLKSGCLILIIIVSSFFLIVFAPFLFVVVIEPVFDFDDETVLLTEKYRVVKTSDVFTSGGRSYFAILKRNGIGEYYVLKSDDYRRLDNPTIVEVNGKPALLLDPTEGGHPENYTGRDTIWIDE